MPEDFGAFVVEWFFKIGLVSGSIFVTFVLAGGARRIVESALRSASIDESLTRFLGTMARWAILVISGVAILGTFGIETTSFAAILVGAGLAIGLALQGTLSNISSGVLLLVFRPFKIGDAITVADKTGIVQGLDLFTTTLSTPDDRRIIIPNGQVFGATITNMSHDHGNLLAVVSVGVEYSADVDKTRKVLSAACEKVEGRLEDRGHVVVLMGLGASSVDWEVRVWTTVGEYWGVLEKTTVAVKKALEKAKIGIPYQTVDINIVSGSAK